MADRTAALPGVATGSPVPSAGPERWPVAEGIGFGEAPRWHGGRLWFSDMPRGVVCRLAGDGAVEQVCTVPGRPSGLGWLPDGRLLVVSMRDRALAPGTREPVSHRR